jgi:hypothetical protein
MRLQTAEQRAAYRAAMIPQGAVKDARSSEHAEVYTFERAGALYAIGFWGSAGKPSFHYRFRTAEGRERHIAGFFVNVQGRAQMMAERKAKRTAFRHTLKVGDVLRSSWGYDQTNIDYYQVVEVCGKHVVIREIAQESEVTAWEQGKCVPKVGAFIGEPMRKLVQEGDAVRIASYACAYKIDGREVAPGCKVYAASHWTAYA